jgi:hypothetical protein
LYSRWRRPREYNALMGAVALYAVLIVRICGPAVLRWHA